MKNNIRYVHTNIIARDWRKLVDFYVAVFGCEALPPERHLSGQWVDQLTTLNDATIRGMHLRLPGCDAGTTLEIFSYEPEEESGSFGAVNRCGLGHLAFQMDSVEAVLAELLEQGGSQLGELVKQDYGELGVLTVVYARDPEGNIVELQNWQR